MEGNSGGGMVRLEELWKNLRLREEEIEVLDIGDGCEEEVWEKGN